MHRLLIFSNFSSWRSRRRLLIGVLHVGQFFLLLIGGQGDIELHLFVVAVNAFLAKLMKASPHILRLLIHPCADLTLQLVLKPLKKRFINHYVILRAFRRQKARLGDVEKETSCLNNIYG